MNQELKEIKKKYGEEMAHFCREHFATLLETEGLLSSLLFEHFDASHELYNDLKDNDLFSSFIKYIYSFTKEIQGYLNTNKTPKELLDSVGYELYECNSEEDIQKFKKYYAPGEELCTFHGGRLETDYVFFAVKKDVDKIKREDFEHPERQDEYGTSVISIQFDRMTNYVSIKNRYNHTVNNPNSTFSNNLDNIVDGLTDAFERVYGFKQKEIQRFEIPNYVMVNGKYYKYNREMNHQYYCTNNVFIKDHQVITYPKERYILFDYFLLDMKEKKICLLDKKLRDSFIDTIETICNIQIVKEEDKKKIMIKTKNENNIEITLNQNNQMIAYKNDEIKIIGNDFCFYNFMLEDIELPNVEKIGNGFCYYNRILKKIELPNVKKIGNDFCYQNRNLKKIEFSNVEKIGNNFCFLNTTLENISFNHLKEIGNGFCGFCENFSSISLPSVVKIGNDFCHNCSKLEELNVPNLKVIGDAFCDQNQAFKEISFPSVEQIGNQFCSNNYSIKKVFLPNVISIGNAFLSDNRNLEELSLPNVEFIESHFCDWNTSLKELILPYVEKIGDNFLSNNPLFEKIYAPNLVRIGDYFLYRTEQMKQIDLPNVEKIGNSFCFCNNAFEEISFPKVKEIGYNFCYQNQVIKTLFLPNVIKIGEHFCYSNQFLQDVFLPSVQYIGNDFCYHNNSILNFDAPEAKMVGIGFLHSNSHLHSLCLGSLESFLAIRELFYNSTSLEVIELGENFRFYEPVLEYKKRKLEEEAKKRKEELKLKITI